MNVLMGIAPYELWFIALAYSEHYNLIHLSHLEMYCIYKPEDQTFIINSYMVHIFL